MSLTNPSRTQANAGPPAASKLGTKNDCLDGFVLIEGAQVTDPNDVHEVTLSNKGLARVNEADCGYFSHLSYLVADDNRLKFGDLGCFTALSELHLRCNALRSLASSPGSFPNLVSLDVSFNQIHPETIPHLGTIPTLRTVHLGSNSLVELPNSMQNVKNVTTLILDSNHLSENAVGKLALMPNLQHLDLSSNGISRFVLSQRERERELFPSLRRCRA